MGNLKIPALLFSPSPCLQHVHRNRLWQRRPCRQPQLIHLSLLFQSICKWVAGTRRAFLFPSYCGRSFVCHSKWRHMFTPVNFSSGERLCADDLAVAPLLLAQATLAPWRGSDSELKAEPFPLPVWISQAWRCTWTGSVNSNSRNFLCEELHLHQRNNIKTSIMQKINRAIQRWNRSE